MFKIDPIIYNETLESLLTEILNFLSYFENTDINYKSSLVNELADDLIT